MSLLHLTIVTPDGEAYSDDVDMVTLETSQGEIGILPHHASLMAQIIPGHLRIKKGSKTISMATGDGLLQIANNKVSLITDLAENSENINEKEVEDARKRAQQALEQKLTDEEYADTIAILDRSLAQLKVKRRHRSV